MHNHPNDAPKPVNTQPDARLETSDVSASAMARWGVALLVFMFGSMLAMLIYYMVLGGQMRAARTAATAEQRLAPWPRLQANPIKEYQDFQREQKAAETSYAWVDPTRDVVRIPVDRAVELVLERGLPRWRSETPPEGVTR